MHLVRLDDILDYQTYEDIRPEFRKQIMAVKEPRRIHLGVYLTFLFENTVTMRYQVLEMVRAERMVREADIQHEIDTYNSLLGGPGVLACSLLIEIDDREMRDGKLREWLALPSHLYLKLADGTKIRPEYDAGQIGEDRLSSVQYLKFDTKGQAPVAIGADLPQLMEEMALSEVQRKALEEDLASDWA